ncbi:MAG TPA: FG-GAP-like repeat-containing protein, partial [Fimbriimonadaceae bacterium]|nr:FG-GAP-like repeat-containing protein [Fimbriimonadaceae bacterium]
MLLALLLAAQTKSVRFLPPTPLLVDGAPIEVDGGHGVPTFVDLNGDGKPDLVVGQFTRGEVQVFLNKGTKPGPTFQKPTLLQAGGKPVRVSYGCCIGAAPQFGDLDGDGVTDLVSGSYTGGLYFFKGTGKGAFSAGVPLLPKDEYLGATLVPALADWDGDGRPDLVVGTQRGEVILLKNLGQTHFATPTSFTSEGKPIIAKEGGPTVFDFDGDGVLDLLVGDVGGTLTIYFGKKEGGTDLSAGKSVLPADRRPPFPGIRLRPTVFDWNHDGKPDIIFGDFRPDGSPVLPVPTDVQQRLQSLNASSSALAFRVLSREKELEAEAQKQAGITDLSKATKEQMEKYQAALEALSANDDQLKALGQEKADLERQIDALSQSRPVSGTLW